jgi:hypothetical protein
VTAVALIACAVAVASAAGFDPDSDFAGTRSTILPRVTPGRGATLVDVGGATVGRPIAPGFVGLSLEYSAIEPYAGANPSAIDPVVVQLIRNLAPGQSPVLRIGGDSTDWAWWRAPHMRKPAGIRIELGARFGSVLAALSRALHARLILGINLEVDSPRIAAIEAARLIHSVGLGSVQALELGNEPELYGRWPWFVRHHRRVMARAAGYDIRAYGADFRRIARVLPGVALAGPALGGPLWIHRVGEFISQAPRLALVTVHAYPLQHCYTPLGSATYPTILHLLADAASRSLAQRFVPTVRLVRAHGLSVRVDEINSVSCGGAPGISNTFASALWALDTLFALARAGVDGVNVHTFRDSTYRLFGTQHSGGRWRANVAPEYYGLLLFARAAPAGSRLLRVTGGSPGIRVWATRGRDGVVRVVLINDTSHTRVVVVGGHRASAKAAYQALRGPGLRATGGISLGGVGFGPNTETGILPPPRPVFVRPTGGRYVLRLPGPTAEMLTIPAGSRPA